MDDCKNYELKEDFVGYMGEALGTDDMKRQKVCINEAEKLAKQLKALEPEYRGTNLYELYEILSAVICDKCEVEPNENHNKYGLPSEVVLTKDGNGYRLPDEFVDSVNEYLADTYGFCNGGWAVEIKVSNIDWDTSEQEAYEAQRS